MTLDEEEGDLIVREVALLADPLVLNEAIDGIIRREERFPTIATIRSYYRTVADARRPRALPERARETDIPEWVQVWYWHTRITRPDRSKANTTSRQAVDDRPPVKLRDFPQYPHPGDDAYTMEEYEQIKAAWVKSGSPTVGTASEIFAGVG
jgi:hypothetical protein